MEGDWKRIINNNNKLIVVIVVISVVVVVVVVVMVVTNETAKVIRDVISVSYKNKLVIKK